RTLLASHGGFHGATLAQTAQSLLAHFTAQLLRNVARLREMPGATAAFRFLNRQDVFIALGSGFPLAVTQAIACVLARPAPGLVTGGLGAYVAGWQGGGGRLPTPHMLPCLMQAAGLLRLGSPVDRVLPDFDYSQVLKVGDTVQDVAEGCNVGALTIAVASG